jgi:hypothetical protein
MSLNLSDSAVPTPYKCEPPARAQRQLAAAPVDGVPTAAGASSAVRCVGRNGVRRERALELVHW